MYICQLGKGLQPPSISYLLPVSRYCGDRSTRVGERNAASHWMLAREDEAWLGQLVLTSQNPGLCCGCITRVLLQEATYCVSLRELML